MSTSERGEHNEIGFRNVDEEAEHDESAEHGSDPGAEGGESDATDKPPAAPADDDSPLGDTDQHSDADA
jgi:hypothetical protein